jgi:anti-anti-sigma factor
MRISPQVESDGYTIHLSGELSASESIRVYQAIEEAFQAGKKLITVNCKELQAISLTGFGAFLAPLNQAEEGNRAIVLYEASPKVKKIIFLLGLDQVLPVFSTAREANAYKNNFLKNAGTEVNFSGNAPVYQLSPLLSATAS